jgi:hypothetical protein
MLVIMKIRIRTADTPVQQNRRGKEVARFKKTNRTVRSATQQVSTHIPRASREATRVLITLLSGLAIIMILITAKTQPSQSAIKCNAVWSFEERAGYGYEFENALWVGSL